MPRYSDGMRVLIRSMLSTQGGKDYGYSDVHPSKRYPRGVDPPGMIRLFTYDITRTNGALHGTYLETVTNCVLT
ncbi:hypothetical protein ABG067_006576 [Albugo candida]